MNAPLYTLDILRLASSGDAYDPQPGDRTGSARSATCGSEVEAAVALDRDGRIARITQRVRACAFGQASATLFAEAAVGLERAALREGMDQVAGWLAGTNGLPERWSGYRALEPARGRAARHPAILLPFRAALAATEDLDR